MKRLVLVLALLVAGILSVSAQLTTSNVGEGGFGGAAASFTTWNPADKSANLTLSGGNLTVTYTGSSGQSAVRSVASHSSGKLYYEHKITNGTAATDTTGIANSTAVLSNFVGSNLNGCGVAGDGHVYINGSAVATIQTWANGDTISIAVDIGGQLIWFRTNAGNWNNNVSNDPATGVGGISISTLNAGPYFAAVGQAAATAAGTSDFGATAYAQSVPSGYGNW